ncbi:lysosome-associated membrane glycoprotein 1-like [Paramormyrops kingsleyae]|uniref:lysosome-associated membrane glycoprotein 1-like n=1 Tax=Paramormyrops kingsleyae TaxID=1676925 RepID=UPI003B975AEA
MKRAFLIITLACAVAVASALDNRRKSKPSATVSPPGDFDASTTNTTTHAPNTTTHAPNTTTHAPNTTTHAPNTTTHAPNTTTHAPNTTTHAPNTTTHAPNTTTHAPNTTTHAPNTTTHAPNTTTTHAPTPPTPTPPTNLTVGSYVVKNDTVMCGKATVAIQIKLQSSSKPSEMGSFIIQPNKTVAVGQCTDATSNFTLSFPEGTLTLLFQKNSTEKSVYITKVAFNVNYPILPSGPTQNSVSNESLHLLSTTIGHSYSCKNMTLFMGSGYFLEMTSLKLQAFNFTKGDFGLPDNCPADKPDYTVAIVVAVVLIILIVIVIVVYLIGRKKRTDGYQAL